MRRHKQSRRILVSVLVFSLILGNSAYAVGAPSVPASPPASETPSTSETTEDTPSNPATTEAATTEAATTESTDETGGGQGGSEEPNPAVDKTALKDQIALAETKKEEDYTPESYKNLKDKLEVAKAIDESETASETAVQTAAEDLKTAIDNLKLINVIDKTALKEQIDRAELLIPDKESYTTATFDALTAALTSAKTIYENADSDQTTVDNAAASLKTAIEQLIERAKDKTGLKQSIDTALTYKGWLYTSDTYKKVTTALTKAQTIYDNIDATQKEVDDQKAKLDTAIAGLKEDVQPYQVVGDTYYYDVRSFGAVPNDGTSDKPAIQEALDKAGEDHKIVVTVTGGLYYIGSEMSIQSNTTIQMDSASTIRRNKSTINMLKVTNANHKSTTFYGYTLGHDITITGGTWDGGDISKATEAKDLIYIGHSQNVMVSNATIKNCYGSHALEFAGVTNATVTNCTFTGFRYASDNFTAEAVQLDICDKTAADGTEWTPGYTMDGTTCKNITVSNNKFIDYPRGVGSHHVYSEGAQKGKANNGPYENIIITNNTFKRSSASTQNLCSSGIFIMGAKNITITKNTIDKYSYGIWLKSSSGITLKNNKLKYNSGANIIYSGNTGIQNATVKFTVTQDKYKSKKLKYTCPTMKKGYVKTAGKTYRFKKAKSTHTVKLKKKIKRNQKMTFYGQDANGNKFYRIYYTAKKSSK
ncbi:MAG: right-handed parallel beta-helix repeat-containing protein [Clostridium sp.]|nr:right-handed parallel beta-helix repeat-containing protein [Clostridium sp.]